VSAPQEEERPTPERLEGWEKDQIEALAHGFEGLPTDELKGHLFAKLAELKRHPPADTRDWKSYCWHSLRNERSNFARWWQRRQAHEWSPSQIESVEEPGEEFFGYEASDEDTRLAVRVALQTLPPEIRHCARVYEEEGYSQARTAIRLGKHRNTIRLWLQRIREAFEAQGLP
jgi:DNA-directed RNA polymerase specialized sigma24 family protein